MAAERLIIRPNDSTTTGPVHVDGNFFKNDGQIEVEIDNQRAFTIKITAVAVGRCTQGFLHNGPGDTTPLLIPSGDSKLIDPIELDPYRFNSLVSTAGEGFTMLTYTDNVDNPLPDDGGGHPNNITIIARRVSEVS